MSTAGIGQPAPPSGATDSRPLLFVCSGGGHLTQLLALRSWWEDRPRAWVSFGTEQVRSSLAGERLIPCYHPTTRHLGNLLSNTVLAWRTVRTDRPAAIGIQGAAVGVQFMLLGRLAHGAPEYQEVLDRKRVVDGK